MIGSMDTANWHRWIDKGKTGLALKQMKEEAKKQQWSDLEEQISSLLNQLNNSQDKTMLGLRAGELDDKTIQRVTAFARPVLRQLEERLKRLDHHGNWVSEDDVAISMFMRGQKEYMAGHTAQAIELFTQVLEEAPLFAEAHVERGVAYTTQSPPDYPAAIKDFNNALRIRPGLPTALLNRGIVYYTYLEDYPKACKDWREAYAGGLEVAKDYLDQYCKP
ncbi:MAG: tetratricopeptide repeat protein [Bacteroidetes bacterium]|jgi:tetratricopeptide (TPR) repeat protein|nr:tetratricopeptide repeat protein [Bacteroidota bacterium]